jgi:Flp pilus assembly pilin Flp
LLKEVDTMLKSIKRFWRSEEGAGLTEYAILLALIAAIAAIAVSLLGNALSNWFTEAGQEVESLNATGLGG